MVGDWLKVGVNGRIWPIIKNYQPKYLEIAQKYRTFANQYGIIITKKHNNMENKKEIKPLSREFIFSDVPTWYVLCTNGQCQFQSSCLRYLAGSRIPEDKEIAMCVMPKTLKDGKCRWYDKRTVAVFASGFSHLYDKVMKMDYTKMRKAITSYLHGAKLYYEYKRGDRPLSPEQQQWIRDYVKSCGYDWEVEFDRYFEGYVYHHLALLDNK